MVKTCLVLHGENPSPPGSGDRTPLLAPRGFLGPRGDLASVFTKEALTGHSEQSSGVTFWFAIFADCSVHRQTRDFEPSRS